MMLESCELTYYPACSVVPEWEPCVRSVECGKVGGS